jgi:hypothetical protein
VEPICFDKIFLKGSTKKLIWEAGSVEPRTISVPLEDSTNSE